MVLSSSGACADRETEPFRFSTFAIVLSSIMYSMWLATPDTVVIDALMTSPVRTEI